MLRAPAAEAGLLGWVLLVLLWVGFVLLARVVVLAVWRLFFPPQRGEYVRVLTELPPEFESSKGRR